MTELPWLRTASLFASGSDALARLVVWGVRAHGWRRVWLPSYYCPDVPSALTAAVGSEAEMLAYPDASLWAPADVGALAVRPGDVAVVANQLGVREAPDTSALAARGAVVVEDHSHDLISSWALESTADYAFASLRKTLPIPDGGAVWSPMGREVPPEPDDADEVSAASPGSAERLASALADRGRRTIVTDRRLRYRALARAAASPAGTAPFRGISPVSRALLPQMPVGAWRDQRRRNLAVLAAAAEVVPNARVLGARAGGVAFALTLVFDTAEQRLAAQARLAARAVVPTVLWPLGATRDWGVSEPDADLSSRILSIHGDQRYDESDMRRLAGIIREALDA
jgi:hypothetical protein